MSSRPVEPEVSAFFASCPVLSRIETPQDVKNLSEQELIQLSDDLRKTIIEVTSRNGGHLASPLGAVELTVALHAVFSPGTDRIIWDVGHQCHAYKLLTGRRDAIFSIRKKGGLSGYPKISESPYDAFGTGHSSTSISAALGMAIARDYRKEDHSVIAVIGDGALTGGMALEALSHAGSLKSNLIVILNDNEMSISKNVGALSSSLSRLITGGLYNRAKGDLKTFMEHTVGKSLTDAARRFEHSVKGFFVPGAFFEELGFRYVGPVDGNDVHTLVECLKNLKNSDGPVLFHCVTQKGKGFPYAEEDPLTYHGVRPDQLRPADKVETPSEAANDTPAKSFTDGFAAALIEAAEADDRIVGITAAMPTGTGISKFEERFPDRAFDVGICEQHAVTFAAGLATQGMRPVAAIYSTFLQRGYDQFIHDVCLQNLPVVFAIDRAGLVGEDSPTQQGAFDISFLRSIPNVTVMVPRDNVDLRLMLHWALKQDGPVAIRYARAKAPQIGHGDGRIVTKGEILREGTDGYFLAIGPVLATCLDAARRLETEGLSLGVADARLVKPLDTALLHKLIDTPVITVEENTLEGGFGSAVLEFLEAHDLLGHARVKRLGFPDKFLDHATRDEQLADVGLHTEGLLNAARHFLGQDATHPVK